MVLSGASSEFKRVLVYITAKMEELLFGLDQNRLINSLKEGTDSIIFPIKIHDIPSHE